MTSARIVTPGQAMATIPTMTAKMPSRINEVDDDLNMTGVPSACLSRTTVRSVVRVMFSRPDARRFRPTSAAYRDIAAGYAELTKEAGVYSWPGSVPEGSPSPSRHSRRGAEASTIGMGGGIIDREERKYPEMPEREEQEDLRMLAEDPGRT